MIGPIITTVLQRCRQRGGRTDNTSEAIARSLLSVSRGKMGLKIKICRMSKVKQKRKKKFVSLSVMAFEIMAAYRTVYWRQSYELTVVQLARVKEGTTIVN